MKPLDRYLQGWRIAKVKPFIPAGARVLDIGCADGKLFQLLGAHLGEGVGLDPDLPALESGSNFRLLRGYFPNDLPDAEPFDAITMMAVLEHIPLDRQASLAESCLRHLRTGGKLIVTVPSAAVDHILAVLRTLRLVDGMALEQHYGFDARTTGLFTKAGFKPVKHARFQLGLNNLFVFEK